MKIAIINGPNINMLGIREPDVYGHKTYKDLCDYLVKFSDEVNVELLFFQDNGEKEIIDFIHNNFTKVDGFVINPAAYTHYSYAIHDAIKSVPSPFIEVHLSNINSREEFRSKSVISPACIGTISGFGFNSYKLAVAALIEYNSI